MNSLAYVQNNEGLPRSYSYNPTASEPGAYAHEQPTDVRRQVHERKEAEPRVFKVMGLR